MVERTGTPCVSPHQEAQLENGHVMYLGQGNPGTPPDTGQPPDSFLRKRLIQLSLPYGLGAIAERRADRGLPSLGRVRSSVHFAQLHAGG